MNNDEMKRKIVDIIGDVYLVNAPIKNVFKPIFVERIADSLILAGIGDVKKAERELNRIEVLKQERFAEKHGFTPDCTPYYIAEQYKHRAEVAEAQVKTYEKIIEKAEKEFWRGRKYD